MTWTQLPQGFKNFPMIFDEALREDLGEYRTQNLDISLLQCMDDLLIVATDQKTFLRVTENLLQSLGNLGFRALAKKAQICKQPVIYLGIRPQRKPMIVLRHPQGDCAKSPFPHYCKANEGILGHCWVLPPLESWVC